MRLFFGIPVSAPATAALAEVSARLPLQRGWRPLEPHNWHITLSFLGDTDGNWTNALADLGERVAAASEASSVKLDSLQWWPSADRPRLLAAVAEQAPALQSIRKLLNAGLRELGVAFDGKPLRAHVTLVRLERGVLIRDLSVPPCDVTVEATTLALYVSEKSIGGKRYRPIWEQALQPRSPLRRADKFKPSR